MSTLGEQTAGIVHGMKRFVIQDQYLIELTVCRYYDDKGNILKNVGISPDKYVPTTIDTIKNNTDIQLVSALQDLGVYSLL